MQRWCGFVSIAALCSASCADPPAVSPSAEPAASAIESTAAPPVASSSANAGTEVAGLSAEEPAPPPSASLDLGGQRAPGSSAVPIRVLSDGGDLQMLVDAVSSSGGDLMSKLRSEAVPNAGAVVSGMAPAFRRCYNKGLQEDPKMRGSARVTAKIGPNGEVLSASLTGGTGLSTTVTSCITAVVSSRQFGPPEGGGATIVIPVSFTAAE